MKTKAIAFGDFFECCVGSWATERTYHYMRRDEVERSRTEFTILPLSPANKTKVLADNQYVPPANLDEVPGYHLNFETVSETGEEVSQSLNFLFVPRRSEPGLTTGDYLRDRAYEEERPIISHFSYRSDDGELVMTTNYTRVVAVDSITLINPELRIRKILTYERPPEEQPLDRVVLAGFGVECKQ